MESMSQAVTRLGKKSRRACGAWIFLFSFYHDSYSVTSFSQRACVCCLVYMHLLTFVSFFVWRLKALVALPRTPGAVAMAVGKKYGSMRALLKAYLDPTMTVPPFSQSKCSFNEIWFRIYPIEWVISCFLSRILVTLLTNMCNVLKWNRVLHWSGDSINRFLSLF